MSQRIKALIEKAKDKVPPPISPSDITLKKFVDIMSGDIDKVPDVGKYSLSFLLSVSTAICAYTAYRVGYYKALLASDKTNAEYKAMVEYWVGMDRAYERYAAAISREISLRRDAWEREGKESFKFRTTKQ